MLHLSLLQLVRMMERIHIYDVLPRQCVYVHTHDAVRAAVAALETGNEVAFSDSPSAVHGKDASSKDVSSKDVQMS